MRKARVFISCGQRNATEKGFGDYLFQYFTKKGFDPYFAEEIHNSKPLLLSVLDSLKSSEYFISFNPLRRDTKDIGSLFVQQEMAVAAAIGLPMLYFYQAGVNKLHGMASGLHLNGIEINKPAEFKPHLDKLTKTWDSTSQNQLFLETQRMHTNVALLDTPTHPLSNWFHICVTNGSSFKQAKNCRAYVEDIVLIRAPQFSTSDYKQELIWAGTGVQTISIKKKAKRDFDAIWTIQGSGEWNFHSLDTSTAYTYPTLKDGEYELTYLVVSDNFPDARIKLAINLSNDSVAIISETQL